MISPVTIIIVEDDQALRQSLCDYLMLSGFAVEGVGSGLDFYQSIKGKTFDVAVIDIGLPDQSGFVLVEYARKNTDMGLIIITANDSINARITGYQSGSDLFLTKPVDCRELAAAITSIATHRNESPSHANIPEAWVLERLKRLLTAPDGTQFILTAKEYELLDLLVCAPGETVSREKLLLHIYKDTSESNSRSLDSLVRRLRRKFKQNGCCQSPILTSYASGYLFSATIHLS
ncbi:MAG: response regulator transcription factor [Methylobacter sp.]|nr:response regulator transcription factor [Methylobacter sp.]MDP2429931.1 response regulator transcription factor [Methylobacter sp.]MDP3056089.1 response regulator transcription factor [Methylobacter sp.]MDP3362860.1 response regulator transcription factor [Methylobacter sp.]MDZ4219884.1 response regulator transcription factor [Methylobacter sp.]